MTTLILNALVLLSTRGLIFHETSKLPECNYALILGTDALRRDGSQNLHFFNRTRLGAEAYLSGKAKHLLISGNKDNRGFNEVLGMEKEIIARNVPEAAIETDFEGARTWESIRRAKESYHLQKIIVVTDDFHAPRALFLCRHFGIDAVAFSPPKEPLSVSSLRFSVREYFARVKAFLDIIAS